MSGGRSLSGYRIEGIGQVLMKKTAEEILQYHPNSKLYLWVLKANVSAIQFYEKNGGTKVEETLYDNPGGGQSPICRYVWEDLSSLLDLK